MQPMRAAARREVSTKMARHRGRFKWRKYSKYNGNLRGFWTAKDRPDVTRHRKPDDIQALIATAVEDYFAMLRRDDYVVDGVNPQEVADIVLHVPAVDFDIWLRQGIEQGWCGPPLCVPHDGIGITGAEEAEYDDGGDPCYHALRLYSDADAKTAVEANHSPSVWRATNMR